MTFHSDLHDVVINLSIKALISLHARDDPFIHTIHTMQGWKAFPSDTQGMEYTKVPKSIPEDLGYKGGLLMQYFWRNDTNSIQYMCVINTEVYPYINRDPDKVLQVT